MNRARQQDYGGAVSELPSRVGRLLIVRSLSRLASCSLLEPVSGQHNEVGQDQAARDGRWQHGRAPSADCHHGNNDAQKTGNGENGSESSVAQVSTHHKPNPIGGPDDVAALGKERESVMTPTMIPPVGAVVTDSGLTFSIAPVNLLSQPMRLRCTSCQWQATVTGQREVSEQTGRHALAHSVDVRPRIAYLPTWLPWLKGRK